jgi:poly [ADP-ribose] polymerase
MTELKSFKIEDKTAPDFGANYDVIDQLVLNMTDIGSNNNKFYSIELQESNGDYRIFTHYGRVGVTGVKEARYVLKSDIQPKPGVTIDDYVKEIAKKEYAKIVKSKQKKGYVAVDVVAADVGSQKAKIKQVQAKSSSSSSLDSRVNILVEQIYEEASKTLSSAIRTPLGSLSESQIEKGAKKLEEIRQAIQNRDLNETTDLSSSYYSLIPQRFSARINPAEVRIDTTDKADRQEELLQLMRDVYKVKDSLESEVMAKYKAINAEINPLEPSHPEYKRLEKKVKETQSSHHHTDLLINNIYKIELKTTKGRYNPKMLSEMELFHGSANKNILGILQRGLLIAPPCAAHSGAAFGRGIYFARHSTKSAQYSTRFFNNLHGNGFLFIADVAVGKMEKVKHYDFRNKGASAGYDSVLGVAGADLIHDEFIVYNVNQVELKYVIDFTPRQRR